MDDYMFEDSFGVVAQDLDFDLGEIASPRPPLVLPETFEPCTPLALDQGCLVDVEDNDGSGSMPVDPALLAELDNISPTGFVDPAFLAELDKISQIGLVDPDLVAELDKISQTGYADLALLAELDNVFQSLPLDAALPAEPENVTRAAPPFDLALLAELDNVTQSLPVDAALPAETDNVAHTTTPPPPPPPPFEPGLFIDFNTVAEYRQRLTAVGNLLVAAHKSVDSHEKSLDRQLKTMWEGNTDIRKRGLRGGTARKQRKVIGDYIPKHKQDHARNQRRQEVEKADFVGRNKLLGLRILRDMFVDALGFVQMQYKKCDEIFMGANWYLRGIVTPQVIGRLAYVNDITEGGEDLEQIQDIEGMLGTFEVEYGYAD